MINERSLVVVSGYYGFDNLGDEAILEELCIELKKLVPQDKIIILSQNPELTAKRYEVQSIKRNDFQKLWQILLNSKLFISGGGGLFQNTRSLGSILFYGLQILMAKANAVKILIYAQGIGPLKGNLAKSLCQQVFSKADQILLRDDDSISLVSSWKLPATRTADPVWSLETSVLPEIIDNQIKCLKSASKISKSTKIIGISLRPSDLLTQTHLENLSLALVEILDKDDVLLLLPLQAEQDLAVLKQFEKIWRNKGRNSEILNTEGLYLPSQWMAVFSQLDMLIGMRLHALIMALKCGLPVAGIAYDPKVSQVLAEFEQACLILTKEDLGESWKKNLKMLMDNKQELAKLASMHTDMAKKLSCQNFQMLAKILEPAKE